MNRPPKIYLLLFFLLSYCLLFARNDTSGLRMIMPSATISGTTTVCQNSVQPLIRFTGSGGTAPYSFSYTVSGLTGNQTITTTSGDSVSVPVSTANTGIFTYTLISVTDSSGTQQQSGSATVTVNNTLTVDFNSTRPNNCSDTAIQFTSVVPGTGNYTYLWDFGDGQTSTDANPNHSYITFGCLSENFTARLTVTSGTCSGTISKSINVLQKPDISFADLNNQFSDPFNNCANASSNSIYTVRVGNISGNGCITSFSVDWGDGITENNVVFPLTHNYTTIGAFRMTITAFGGNGCNSTRSYIVKNLSNPIGGINSPGTTQNLCAPTTNLQFSISNWGGNSIDTRYTINYGDGTPLVILTQNQLNSSIYYNAANPLNSANYPIPHTYSTSSCPVPSFELRLEIANACGITPLALGNITILTTPQANFSNPAAACANSAVTFTNTTIAGSSQNCSQNAIYTWDFGDGSPIITTSITSAQNINHTYLNPGTYTVVLTSENFCGKTSRTRTICIETPVNPQFTLNTINGCTPLSIVATNSTPTTNSCGPPAYSWSVTYTATNCGTSSISIPNQSSTNASYNFSEPGNYEIRLTATNSCGSFSTSQTVTIKKPPSITSINGITANYCGPSNINPIAVVNSCTPNSSGLTYNWSFPGGIPATSTAVNPGTINYASAGTYTVSLIVTNECGPSTVSTRSFTINETPFLTNTPLTQTVCSGFSTSTVNLTSNPTGASFSWTATATAGISGFTTFGTNTITGQTIFTTSSNPGTITYAIRPVLNGCPGPVTNYVITVNPAPTITSHPTSSTVCSGGTPTILSFTTTGIIGTPVYQWYSNTINSNIGGAAIAGATNVTFAPPTNIVGTLYYYCVITLTTGGCTTISTNPATITIAPSSVVTLQPLVSQNLCVGATIPTALTVSFSGGTGIASYQWFSNTTSATTGGTLIAGATSSSYSPPIFTSAGNYYYYLTISLTGSNCLPVTTNSAEIIVFADPTISSQPIASQTLCQNATPASLSVNAIGGNGTYSYQWFSNTINSNTGGTLISGAVNSFYNPPTSATGTRYYYALVSQDGTQGCSVTSSTAALVVIPAPTISQPVSSTICAGGTPAILSIVVSGATGTPSYQWFANSINSNIGGIAISGATSANYSPPNSPIGTNYYYCVVTLPSGGCSNITSNTATVAITSGTTIDTQPTPTQSLCVGGTIIAPLNITFSGGTGNATYQWFSNSSSLNSGGTLIPGATNANFTPPVFTTIGTFYYYAVLTLSGDGCGSIASNVASIAVVADPIVDVQPLLSQSVCQNVSPASLSVAVSGGILANYNYQWYSNTVNDNISGTTIFGATNNSYNPPTSIVGTLYYYCVITQTNGSNCTVSSNTAAVTVNLAPTFSMQPQSSIICIGEAPSLLTVNYVNGAGIPSYQWFSNSINSIIGSAAIAGANNNSYNPPNTTSGVVYYYCIITLPAAGGCSDLISTIASVTINPNPIISNKTALICSGNDFTIVPINSGSEVVPAGTTYTWQNPVISPVGSITGASAQNIPQSIISQNLINTTTSPATVTYTVIPLSGICDGSSFTVTVTVNPAISANVTSSNSRCFSANNGSIQTNITGGIPFNTGDPYQILWTGPNGFTSTAFNISNLAPGNYSLSVIDSGGCPVNQTYLITEPNDIILTTILEQDISCFNGANGAINIDISGGTLNYNIAWTRNGIPFSTAEDLSNLSPGIYVITVTDANACGPKTATFTITQPALLQVSLATKTDILCFGDSTGAITINTNGGTLPYTYTWSGPNGFISSNQNLTALFAGTYNLLLTDGLGCSQNLTVSVTQTPEIQINATSTAIICYGNNDASIRIAPTGGVAPYTIGWSNLGTGTFQDNLSAGNYLITVTDALNCVKTLNITIPEAPIFTINPVVKNITCFGDKDGSINLNLIGGKAPLVFFWDDSAVAGTTRNNLGPGTYTINIIDSTPCTIRRSFIILEPQPLVVSANLTNAFDCDDANTGAINLLVSGGSAPFVYSWSNGATTEDLNNIPAGNYLVTVTDVNGCSKQAQYSINRPPPIVIAVQTRTNFDCDTKFVEQTFVANVSGGVPPYQLTWSSGTITGANNEIMNTSLNGTVVLVATDAIGCSATYTFEVATPTLGTPSFTNSSFAYVEYGNYSINDPVQFTNTSDGDFISVLWDFGDGTFSSELSPTHIYSIPKDYIVTQTVTYPFGCKFEQKITLMVDKGYVLVVPTAFTPNNDTYNDSFRPVTKALKNIRLDIYDTWGSLIFSEIGEVIKGWDGKIKTTKVENGNYFCKVSGDTLYGTTVEENHPFVLIK